MGRARLLIAEPGTPVLRATLVACLDAVDRTDIKTRFGTVEYAERGSGEPVLAVHGFFGGP